MALKVVTIAKNDLRAFLRTEKSVRFQSKKVNWVVVTPEDSSSLYEHVQFLKKSGIVEKMIPDAGTGLYLAMNLAIDKIDGEHWIWFLNAGDEFAEPGSVSLIEEIIKETKARWLYGGHILGSSEDKILGKMDAPQEFIPRNQLYARKFISHQSTVFKNELLKEIGGFNESLRIAADWDLMIRASKIAPGLRIPNIMSIFYLGGVSTRLRQKGNWELLKLRLKHLGVKHLPMSYVWYLYRSVRNSMVHLLELGVPKIVNKLRKKRIRKFGKKNGK